MKKVLFTATIAKHILRFHLPYLKWFKEQGYEVHVAAAGDEEIPYCDKKHVIPFERSPFSMGNVKATKMLAKVMDEQNFDIVHTHTPMGSVVTRFASRAARKRGTKVLYTAHGFHFFRGASLKNWLLFYPMEKYLAKDTDAIITINQEDYELIKERNFKTGASYLIPGMGVDAERFKPLSLADKNAARTELGYKADDFILIYVAEFIDRKNHKFVIDAVPALKQQIPQLKVLFAGRGLLLEAMKAHAAGKGLADTIDFLGFRTDVQKLMAISDIGISASKQEGLGLNLAEEMLSGLPVVATLDRGHKELIENGVNGYMFAQNDTAGFTNAVLKLYQDAGHRKTLGDKAYSTAQKFTLTNAFREITRIYEQYI